MTTAYDVPPQDLIKALAEKLKGYEAIKPPEWAMFVKTGVHKEKPPQQLDWWYTRAAAVLRKVYTHGPIGLTKLRAEYGGKRDRGSKRYKARRGSGSIARKVLQQLEAAGLVTKLSKKGRVVTPEGQRLVDNTAHEVLKKIVDKYPGLEKY